MFMVRILVLVLLGTSGLVAGPAATAAAAPNWQLPFPCDQVWDGESAVSDRHYKTQREIDFNRGATSHADLGDAVVASAAGTVRTSAHQGTKNGYGNLVTIDHGGGWTTYYAHLQKRSVKAGEQVEQGDKVGTLGKSSSPGTTFTPHLHFEIRNGPYQSDIQPAFFDGVPFDYPTDSVRSRNCAGSEPGPGTYRAMATLNGRTEKSLSNQAAVDRYTKGSDIKIVCQDEGGPTYGGSNIWDLTEDGLWVTDYYVDTGHAGFSPDLPRCEIPQTFTARETLDGRSSKSLSDTTAPSKYPKGSNVEVVCQAHGGPTYHGSTLWNRTTDDLWVVDYYLSTGTNDFVEGLPRCDLDNPGQPTPPDNPDARSKPADLEASNLVIQFIADYEQFRATPYDDAGDQCTIGYGHLIDDGPCTQAHRDSYGTYTEADGLERLELDVDEAEDHLLTALAETPLRQQEYDAVVSFTFNIGAGGFNESQVREDLTATPPIYDAVPDNFFSFVSDDNVNLCGLYRRRVDEGKIFTDGAYERTYVDCPPGYVD